MVVVSDTSPVNYLVLIGQADLLRQLYQRILLPPAVVAELDHPMSPRPIRDWVTRIPEWVEIVNPGSPLVLPQLDPGETEAISLATELEAGVLLMDERAGRQEARRRGLKVAGTLAILDEAAQAGLVNFGIATDALRVTSFRLSPSVLREIAARRRR